MDPCYLNVETKAQNSVAPSVPTVTEAAHEAAVKKICGSCKKENSPVKCSRCKVVWYCSAVCQKSDWEVHRAICKQAVNSVAEALSQPKWLNHVDKKSENINNKMVGYYSVKKGVVFSGLIRCFLYAVELTKKFLESHLHLYSQLHDDSTNKKKILELVDTVFTVDVEKESTVKNRIHQIIKQFLIEDLKIAFQALNTPEQWMNSTLDRLRKWMCVHSKKIEPQFSPMEIQASSKAFLFPQIFQDLPAISCVDYAIISSGNRNIIMKYLEHECDMETFPLSYFFWLGYEAVLIPKIGDHIVYFSTNNFSITHMGTYREGGLVEAKLGNECPYVYKLNPIDACGFYGDSFAFLRQKI